MAVPNKINCTIHIGSFYIKEKLNIELSFNQDSFIIYFLDPISPKNAKELRELFLPFISDDNNMIILNFIYIKSILIDGINLFKFTLYNPLKTSIFTIIFNHFKWKKPLLSFNYSPPPNILFSIGQYINTKQKKQIAKYIKNFIDVIHLLYDFISVERKHNPIIEEIFLKAFIYGQNYYNNKVKEFNKSQEIKKSISDELSTKIKKALEEYQTKKSWDINHHNKNSSDFEDNDDNENEEENIISEKEDKKEDEGEEPEFNFDNIVERDLFQNYPKFSKLFPEIKIKTSYFAETIIKLIFQLLNINKNDLDEIYTNINWTEIGQRVNGIDGVNLSLVNYRIQNNNYSQAPQNIIENNNSTNDESQIKKWFEYTKKFHEFIPNNSLDNIYINTSEIIQRKFFEILIKNYFGDIINIELEKNKTLSMDDFHQILMVIRRMKKILFTNKNFEYYSDLPFLNEQPNSFYA